MFTLQLFTLESGNGFVNNINCFSHKIYIQIQKKTWELVLFVHFNVVRMVHLSVYVCVAYSSTSQPRSVQHFHKVTFSGPLPALRIWLLHYFWKHHQALHKLLIWDFQGIWKPSHVYIKYMQHTTWMPFSTACWVRTLFGVTGQG